MYIQTSKHTYLLTKVHMSIKRNWGVIKRFCCIIGVVSQVRATGERERACKSTKTSHKANLLHSTRIQHGNRHQHTSWRYDIPNFTFFHNNKKKKIIFFFFDSMWNHNFANFASVLSGFCVVVLLLSFLLFSLDFLFNVQQTFVSTHVELP